MRKILVLRGGALGDFIVTLPALSLLRARWAEARIELAGNATAAQLARARGVIDAVHSQHEARWSALFGEEELPAEFSAWLAEFDLVVNYWPDADGTLTRKFPRRAGQTFLFASAMPERAPAAAHYCEPLRELGLETRDYFFRLEARPAPFDGRGASSLSKRLVAGRHASPVTIATARRQAAALPRRSQTTANPPPLELSTSAERRVEDNAPHPILIHPGSGSPRKNWPAENWRRFIAELPQPIALILGEAEAERWSDSAFAAADPQPQGLVNRPLEELVSHLAGCRLFLGHDSGISHLAAACGAPCVLLFGPTEPTMWAPPAPNVRVLRRGPDLSSLSVEEVRRAALAALAGQT